MNKKLIRLTEGDLHRIVRESVHSRVLKTLHMRACARSLRLDYVMITMKWNNNTLR